MYCERGAWALVGTNRRENDCECSSHRVAYRASKPAMKAIATSIKLHTMDARKFHNVLTQEINKIPVTICCRASVRKTDTSQNSRSSLRKMCGWHALRTPEIRFISLSRYLVESCMSDQSALVFRRGLSSH